jgi:multisubunit Na+/H+ antiporter MnhB subunit
MNDLYCSYMNFLKKEMETDKKKRREAWIGGLVAGVAIGIGSNLISLGYTIRPYFGYAGVEVGSDFVIYGLIFVLIGSITGACTYFKYVSSS